MTQFNSPANFEDLIRSLQSRLATVELVGSGLRISAGVQNLTWAAGAFASNSPVVNHGLSTTPIGVLALPNGTGGPSPVCPQVLSTSSSTFTLYGEFRTGTWAAGGSIPIAWLAIA